MLFAPVRLGSTALSAEVLTADVKNCKHFGPCGVGEKALYLNGFLFDRHYYVALGDIRRVFKRVAMSKGGFTGNGVFGAIPYLVVEYGDGTQKQCTFKREEDVDELLAYLGQVHPEIPRLSVGGEQRLAKKAQQEASRYLKELTPQAQSARKELERARKFLSGYPELTAQLAAAAKAKRINEHTNPAYRWVALAIVLWRGGIITKNGVMLIGTLSVFMNYAQGMMEPVQWLVQVISSLVNVQVNVERFTKLMETESDVRDTPEVTEKYGDAFHPKKENWEPLYGDIEFQDVTFRYPDGSENVLEHFSLKVPQGTNVAIVGETGAGKSTLVNLVCRFFEPTEGRVLIDGRDARARSQLWLHSNIGYVLQTPHLFSGTVLENLRYGRPDATMDEIEAAVKAVSADQIIARLPDGYDSDIGEGGNTLSTGEKQLLSFARALLADPRIFVLDEATSSVDTVTEQLIQNAIEKVMTGRTSFIIAHRLSTIRRADVILVVHDGKIIESGTHRSLMSAHGPYYRLYTRQYREEQTKSMMD